MLPRPGNNHQQDAAVSELPELQTLEELAIQAITIPGAKCIVCLNQNRNFLIISIISCQNQRLPDRQQ
jgi:hypothetical protein